MGLYLCIFEGDDELDGVEVGSYGDFGAFRCAVATHVEGGVEGSLCPTLMLHSDCDGEWSPKDSVLLQEELAMITRKLKALPPAPLGNGWKPEVAKNLGLRPTDLFSCFFDIDGECLIDRLMNLAKLSDQRNLPILFQ